MGSEKAVLPLERRRELLDTAMREFVRHGFGGASLNRIIRSCGMRALQNLKDIDLAEGRRLAGLQLDLLRRLLAPPAAPDAPEDPDAP
ncbi:TetR family transcriptional regulator [Actinomadura soli]|uniref:TetR family transcriptional regulator n=1 Tax=Actinomadura soli TaxID=2508997 RepID=UPI00197ABEA6|nr:TetR family transcriptional regulator [Actinomadura soli]